MYFTNAELDLNIDNVQIIWNLFIIQEVRYKIILHRNKILKKYKSGTHVSKF